MIKRQSARECSSKIPVEKDWADYKDGMDLECAYNNFFGKTLAQATQLFAEHALRYQKDLYYMEPEVFKFYAPAFTNYITSADAEEDSDGASCYMQLVEWMLENECKIINPIVDEMVSVAEKVSTKQGFYDADIDIYGDFKEILSRINSLYTKA